MKTASAELIQLFSYSFLGNNVGAVYLSLALLWMSATHFVSPFHIDELYTSALSLSQIKHSVIENHEIKLYAFHLKQSSFGFSKKRDQISIITQLKRDLKDAAFRLSSFDDAF